MNICLITSSFPANQNDSMASAGLFVRDFTLALAGLDQKVTVLVPEKNITPKEEIPGVEITWFPWVGKKKALGYLRPYQPMDLVSIFSLIRQGKKALFSLHKKKRFDQVFAMWAVPAGYLAKKLKKRYQIPYTTWCLGSDIWVYGKYPLIKSMIKSVMDQSDFLFADGYELCREVSLLSSRNCAFLPSCRSIKPPPKEKTEESNKDFHFLFVGRYAKAKGIDTLLEAMVLYVKKGGKGQLNIYGGGPLEKDVQLHAKNEDIKKQVNIHGYAPAEIYVSALADCDAVIVPSRIESIPIVLSDIMQMKKPVIVTDTGDMGTLLRKYPAGLVVPPENPEALCNAMQEMEGSSLQKYYSGIKELSNLFNIEQSAVQWLNTVISD